jgi:hypothetical protein
MNFLKLIIIINILFNSGYLFLNDEFMICISLIIVFSFLIFMLRKYILYVFYFIFENIYFYFYSLNFLIIIQKLNVINFISSYNDILSNYNYENFLFISQNLFFKKFIMLFSNNLNHKLNVLYVNLFIISKLIYSFNKYYIFDKINDLSSYKYNYLTLFKYNVSLSKNNVAPYRFIC